MKKKPSRSIPPSSETLSRRERQILELVYLQGSVTAVQLQEALLPDELSNSSVRTFLRFLTDKGLLVREKNGREYVYTPTEARPKAGASALKKVLDTFFNGSVEQAVARLMQDDEEIDAEELSRLEALIAAAKKKGN